MIKKDPELLCARNKDGETPLFLAALHGKKGAFQAFHFCPRSGGYFAYDIIHCKRNLDGNTILHVAILGEYFGMKPYITFHLLPIATWSGYRARLKNGIWIGLKKVSVWTQASVFRTRWILVPTQLSNPTHKYNGKVFSKSGLQCCLFTLTELTWAYI